MEWLGARTGRISTLADRIPSESLQDWRVVGVTEDPDRVFTLEPIGTNAWAELERLHFSPDDFSGPAFSNLDFLARDVLLASLNVDDGENFVVIWGVGQDELSGCFVPAQADDAFFLKWASECDMLVGGRPWQGLCPI